MQQRDKDILTKWEAGLTQAEIVQELKLPQSTVYDVLKRYRELEVIDGQTVDWAKAGTAKVRTRGTSANYRKPVFVSEATKRAIRRRDWSAVDAMAAQYKPEEEKREKKAHTFAVDALAVDALRVWCDSQGATLSEGVSEAIRRLVTGSGTDENP